MENRDDQLLQTLGRRNWLILAVLLLLSLFWRSWTVFLGVLSGGLVAIVGYYWLQLALMRMLAEPNRLSTKKFQWGYLARLIVLAGTLFLLIGVVRIHPLGLAIGLSVVLLNLLVTTLQRLL